TTDISTEIDWENRTISKNEQTIANVSTLPEDIWGNALGQTVVSRTESLETYENNKEDLGDCLVDDKGRLLSVVSEVEAARGVFLESAIRIRDKATVEEGFGTVNWQLGAIEIYRTVEEQWDYDYEEPEIKPQRLNVSINAPAVTSFSSGATETITHTVIERQATGFTIPWTSHPTLQRTGESSEIILNLSALRAYQTTTKKWTRKRNKREWSLVTTVKQIQFISNPEGIESIRSNTQILLTSVVAEAFKLKTVSITTEENSNPPEPTRFPVRYSLESKPLVLFKDYASSGGLKRVRSVEIAPNFVNNQLAQVSNSVSFLGDLYWWRYYSYLVAFDGNNLHASTLPLDQITINSRGRNYRFAIDALTVTIEQDSYFAGFSGMLINVDDFPVYEQLLISRDSEYAEEPGPLVLFGVVDSNNNFVIYQ
ncbi:MAG: hypothetical protein ACRDBG_21685, partial [Waterburya sp.]